MANGSSNQPGGSPPPPPPSGQPAPAPDPITGQPLLQPGDEVGGYRIVQPLGRGGMAVVYKAIQLSLNRPVALKVLYPRFANDPNFIQRFEQEAGALASLNHANIVNIIDRGQARGYYFFVMEFVDGKSLDDLIVKNELGAGDWPIIIQGIRDALAYVHGLGIVHRDIKPANILIGRDGRVKVSDFGIVHIAFGELRSQPTGKQAAGTSHYIAPELRQPGGHVDSRADIYALGVTFYKMMTRQMLPEAWQGPSQVNPAVPDDIDSVLLKALQSKPDSRYQTVQELCDDLLGVLWNMGPQPSGSFLGAISAPLSPAPARDPRTGPGMAVAGGAIPAWGPPPARPGTPLPQASAAGAVPPGGGFPAPGAFPQAPGTPLPARPPTRPPGMVPPPPPMPGTPIPGAVQPPLAAKGAAAAQSAAAKKKEPAKWLKNVVAVVVFLIAAAGGFYATTSFLKPASKSDSGQPMDDRKMADEFRKALEAEEQGKTQPGAEVGSTMSAPYDEPSAPKPSTGPGADMAAAVAGAPAVGSSAQPAAGSGSAPASAPSAGVSATLAAPSSTPIEQQLVSIPAGWVRMGDVNSLWASPPTLKQLSAFQIERYEVTNYMYAKFIQETNYPPPPSWQGKTFLKGMDNYPVVEVNFNDAMAYAKWAGRDLPTEAQWERAARGAGGWDYPWGPLWREGASNLLSGKLQPVDAATLDVTREVAGEGCHFMAGNVMEWTKSPFVAYPNNNARVAEFSSTALVLRGGAWTLRARTQPNPQVFGRVSTRSYAPSPDMRFDTLGFRCVVNSSSGL